MKTSRQTLGRWGESKAADYLQEHGYSILERNARTSYGEIDLVACQEVRTMGAVSPIKVVVFVEVKARRSTAYGYPEASVTPRKQAHLLAAAQAYLQAHPELEGDWRVDVIAIQRSNARQEPVIVHFENAVA